MTEHSFHRDFYLEAAFHISESELNSLVIYFQTNLYSYDYVIECKHNQ